MVAAQPIRCSRGLNGPRKLSSFVWQDILFLKGGGSWTVALNQSRKLILRPFRGRKRGVSATVHKPSALQK